MSEVSVDRLQADIDEGALLECAQALIRTPSTTGEEAAVMDVAAAWLRRHGLAVRVLAREKGRPNVLVETGSGERPWLVFNGHLDTVPVTAGERWQTDAFGGGVLDGRLYGRGALDMKGACAAMMEAVRVLGRHPGSLRGTVQLQLVSDEEESGYYGTGFLVEQVDAGQLRRPDCVVIGEKSDLKIRVAERGHFQFQLVFRGRAAHTAMARVSGINPIVHAAAAVLRLDRPLNRFHPAVGHPIISVNRIEAGRVHNQVPGECALTIDRRIIPGETQESVTSEVEAQIAELRREMPDLDCRLVPVRTPDGRDEYSPANMTAPDHPFVEQVRATYRDVAGREPELFVGWGGGTDARLFRARGIPTVVLGGVGSGFHGADEYVEIDALRLLARLYLGIAARAVA